MSELCIRTVKTFRERATRNAESIDESLQRRRELIEEKNAPIVCSQDHCENQEDLEESTEFLKLLKKKHVECQRKILEENEDEGTPTSRRNANEAERCNKPGSFLLSQSSDPVDYFDVHVDGDEQA